MAQKTRAPKAFHCDKCAKRFRSEDALLAHLGTKKHVQCEPCNRFFKCQESLQQHLENSPAHIKLLGQPRAPAHFTLGAGAFSSARANAPKPQRPNSPVHAPQQAQATQPPPEVAALTDDLARRIAALQQLLEPQTGQPALRPLPMNGATYTTIPAARPAQAKPAPPPSLKPSSGTLTPPSTTILKPQPPQPTTAPPPTPPPLTHRGITYTTLTPAQQTTLHPLLLAQCHTRTRLTLEGYALTPNPPHSIPPPPYDPHNPHRRAAVVLDCEMAGTSSGDYPISVSLLDFCTGEVLVNALVQPGAGVVVRNWRSGITGITARRMALAGKGVGSKDGAPLRGWEAARERVLGFVDGETVVVGQAVRFDLKVLGIVCGRVVDSAVVAAEASGLFGGGGSGGGGVEKKITRPVGLVKLCKGLLGVRIRGKGGQAHDSLEDVLATREVVLWCLRNPEELRVWAVKHWQVKSRGGYGWQGKKGDSGRNKKGMQREKGLSGKHKKDRTWPESSYMCDWDGEPLRWEDVVDYDCWPKSPPDWSD